MDRDDSLLHPRRLDIEDDSRLFVNDVDEDEPDAFLEEDEEQDEPLGFDFNEAQRARREAGVRHGQAPRRRPAEPEQEAGEESSVPNAGPRVRVVEVPEEVYRRARSLAERKFGFVKTVFALVLANAVFAAASWWELPPTGKLWFLWPVALSLVAILGLYVRVFLFAGQDLRAIIEDRLDRMTQAEMRRYHHFDR